MRFLRPLLLLALLLPALAVAEEPHTVLITGANKGIGLELTRLYAAGGWKVIATTRNPAEAAELQALAKGNPKVSVVRLDVTDHARIDELAGELQGTPIDHLVNNAGITAGMDDEAFGRMDFTQFDDVLAVNTIAPLKMAEAFVEHVAASRKKTIVNISSSQGSIASVKRPMTYFYRASKAALNMEMRNLALELAPRGIIVGLVGPGLTQTNLTRNLRIPMKQPDEAARLVFEQINLLTPAKSGVLVNYDGTIVPW